MGAGINQEAFDKGLAMGPDVITVDAGSTDSGPACLGTASCKYSRPMVKSDLKIAITGAKKARILLLIGSCGADAAVEEWAEITAEVFKEEGFLGTIMVLLAALVVR
jgi:hypothetical protein